jgi:outer membrane protein assembly factor BamB
LAGTALSSLADTAAAEDWPQFRGQNRDGKSPETGLWNQLGPDGPKLAWMAEGLGEGYASVAVVGNRIYTSGNTGSGQAIVAIDASNGKKLWSTLITPQDPQHSYGGSRTTPTVDGDFLYAVASDGRIVCLRTRDGREVWARRFEEWQGRMMSGWGFSESPLVDGDRVLCTPGGPRGLIVALNKKTGKEIWAAKLPDPGPERGDNGQQLQDGAGYSSMMISNGGGVKQYVQLVGRGVVGVRASDGKILWRYTRVANAVANIPSVLIDGDHVFCSTAYGTGSGLLKLVPAGRNEVKFEEVYWLKAGTLQNKHGGMVLVDGYIYCGHGDGQGQPICVKLADGSIAWGPIRDSRRGEASMAYGDGHAVFRFQNGEVAIVATTPEEYRVVSEFKPAFQERESWAHPVIAGGKLYLREQDKLMCYELK